MWIATSERLPESHQECIVIYRYNGRLYASNATFYGWAVIDGKWMFGDDGTILMWMPFPEVADGQV